VRRFEEKCGLEFSLEDSNLQPPRIGCAAHNHCATIGTIETSFKARIFRSEFILTYALIFYTTLSQLSLTISHNSNEY
jgi:hypothetical protein